MSAPPYLALKKPKVETNDANEVRQQQQQQQKLVSSSSTATTTTTKSNNMDDDDKNDNNNSDNGVSREEQEEALVALIEHRTKEVLTNKQRIAYYKSQVLSFFIFLIIKILIPFILSIPIFIFIS